MNPKIEAGIAQVQREIIEREAASISEYTVAEARQATVHARQDVILLCGHIAVLNRQLATVRTILVALLVVALVIAVRI